jgi:hypothetical protein
MIANDAGRRSYRYGDTAVWNNTADAIDSGGPEKTTRGSASTYAFCLFASVEVPSFYFPPLMSHIINKMM